MTGIDAEALSKLNDQNWRRLGITQTFDRLLVEAAAALSSASTVEVRAAVGQKLQAGAAKFWELSFPQIKSDLCRRGILHEESGALGLSDEFDQKVIKLLTDLAGGVSRVEPTPNVTLEEILDKTKAREAAEKAKKKKTATKAKKTTKIGEAKPKKRATAATKTKKAIAPKTTKAKKAVASTTISSPKKLFTSLKLNKLLDALDNVQLLKSQLATRLKLQGVDLDHFLKITGQLEITRILHDALMDDEMVELHFRGSELAKTSSAERRQVLISLVKELREAAEIVAAEAAQEAVTAEATPEVAEAADDV